MEPRVSRARDDGGGMRAVVAVSASLACLTNGPKLLWSELLMPGRGLHRPSFHKRASECGEGEGKGDRGRGRGWGWGEQEGQEGQEGHCYRRSQKKEEKQH